MTSLAQEGQKKQGFWTCRNWRGQFQTVKAAALQRSLRLQDWIGLAPDLRYITLKYNQYFCGDVPCQEQDQSNQ